jgi:hypothetical protein
MTYLLQIFNAPALEQYESLSEDERSALLGEYMAIAQAPGVLGGHQLQGPDTATTVRVQDGQTLTTDGPFAETKEVVGGYYLYEAYGRALELVHAVSERSLLERKLAELDAPPSERLARD